MTDQELLQSYTKELKLTIPLTVQDLISSHRRVINELNETSRKEYKERLEEVYKKVEEELRDESWIRIKKLKTMTIQELTDLIGESD